MKRRAFIIATTCLASALAAPGIAAAARTKGTLKARFVKIVEPLTVVKIEDPDFKPTRDDLAFWREMFEAADRDFKIFTHEEIEIEERDPPNESYWEVFAGSQSLFKVTVRDIIRADPTQSFYTINTVEFGKLLIQSVKNKGVEETMRLFGAFGDLEGLADDDHVQYYILDPPMNQEPAKRRLRHLRARKVW